MNAILSALLVITFAASAQETTKPYLSSPRRALTAPELKDAPDEWIGRSLEWVQDILANYPPSVPEHPVRRAALIRLDDILHIESAPQKPLVQRHFADRTQHITEEIERTRVTSGARIFKIYNQTWIVRTPSVTIAFDLVPGAPRIEGLQMPKPLLERLVQQSDILFISHLHYDHANKDVARMFLERGKKVIAAEGLWSNDEYFRTRLIYPKRSADAIHRVTVREGGPELRFVAYPGHQGKAPINNVHLVMTPENFSVMHTGDQSSDDNDFSDFQWIAQVGAQHRVNVLLPNCWTTDIQRMLRGIHPDLVLTGHENEMAHTVDHREDYTQTYNHLFGTTYPFAVLAWGESFHFRP